ncbi:MAG: alpha/beta fold hydrolase [Anaerolineae bacterium]
MAKYKVAIIGCGRPRREAGATGFGMAHFHAAGYEASPDAEIVAAVDINPVNLDAFCEEHDVPRGYLSVDEMLENEDVDIVSICLWPHLHAPMTIKVAEAGVRAIHCEKPMALTYGDAKAMVAACEANDVVLTFNHMRRFGAPFRKAKALLDEGAIGELERLEAYTSNLYDWGTHWFDMLFYYNDETPVEWVIGQIDARGSHPIFGAMVEGQGLSFFKYQNGVAGLMVTGGRDLFEQGEPLKSINCGNRLVGLEGTIEVGVRDGPEVRLLNASTGGVWQAVDVEGGMHGEDLHGKAILDLIDALKEGRGPELAGWKALQATELIFATYESSRRRGRVDLPLEVEDSPFMSMLNLGDITTWPDAYVEANGIQIHYWRTGDGSKPPLVLCHGRTDNGLCWTPVARRLESDYDIIMYDARGHGLSDAPDTGHNAEVRADDLAGVVKALDLEKPAVLGHSMGAATAAAAAAKYPDLFSKVVLEDPSWRAEDSPRRTMTAEEHEFWQEERKRQILEEKKMSREALIELARERRPNWPEVELGPWAIAKQQVSPKIAAGRPSAPDAQEQAKSWREIAKPITVSTLLITADPDKDAIVTPEIAEAATELNSKIEVVRIEGAGHNIRREAFEPYMEAITAFLAE